MSKVIALTTVQTQGIAQLEEQLGIAGNPFLKLKKNENGVLSIGKTHIKELCESQGYTKQEASILLKAPQVHNELARVTAHLQRITVTQSMRLRIGKDGLLRANLTMRQMESPLDQKKRQLQALQAEIAEAEAIQNSVTVS